MTRTPTIQSTRSKAWEYIPMIVGAFFTALGSISLSDPALSQSFNSNKRFPNISNQIQKHIPGPNINRQRLTTPQRLNRPNRARRLDLERRRRGATPKLIVPGANTNRLDPAETLRRRLNGRDGRDTRPGNRDRGRGSGSGSDAGRSIICRRGVIRYGHCYCLAGTIRRRVSGNVYTCVTRPLIQPQVLVTPDVDRDRPSGSDRIDVHRPKVSGGSGSGNGGNIQKVALPPLPAPNPGPGPEFPAELFDAPHVPDEVIVFLSRDLTDNDVSSLASDYGLNPVETTMIELTGQRLQRMTITNGRDVAEVTSDIASDPRVISAQPNLLYRMRNPKPIDGSPGQNDQNENAPDPGDGSKEDPTLPDKTPGNKAEAPPLPQRPNAIEPKPAMAESHSNPAASDKTDTKYNIASGAPPSNGAATTDELQYALSKISAPAANHLASGRDTLVAVIDTGIEETHPELEGAVADRFDAIGDRKGAKPDHGTAIAGIVSAHKTVRGVAPDARLLDVRAFYVDEKSKEVEASSFILAKSVDWAFTQGARIFNMSFTGPHDPTLEELTTEGYKKGAIFIAAAGNDGPKAAPAYPAAYRSVIAITATDQADRIYADANRGSYITAAAPGVDILVLAPEQSMNFLSGTSMAAAHASGLAALLYQRNPAISPDRIRSILSRTAHDLGPEGYDEEYGAGRIDAAAALQEATRSSRSD